MPRRRLTARACLSLAPVTAWLAVTALTVPRPAAAAPDAKPSETQATPDSTATVAPEAAALDADPPMTYAEQAPLDVDIILSDTSKAYLQARARLVEHPDLANSAILDRLAAIPAPTKADRKRLMDVLSELGRPEHLPMFVAELRKAVSAAPDHEAAMAAAQRWTHMLVAQGQAATQPLMGLVGDRQLPMAVRATLLDAMVGVMPRAALSDLVILVGRGDAELRGQLARSLKRRASDNAQDRAALLAALDDATGSAEPGRQASLLQFRAAMSATDDAAFSQRLAALARADDASFVVQVAALRGLARQDGDVARQALTEVATTALAAPQSQRSEIVAWLSLTGLADDDARPLAQQHALHQSAAPRLAIVGYRLADLPRDQTWVDGSQDSPWPKVRQAALSRITEPCSKPTLKLLARRARPKSRDGDKDPAVARSTVQALGRCGQPAQDALVDLLNAGAVDIEQRTEAARQLTKNGGAAGADAVASALLKDPPRRFARRLVLALRWVKTPTPKTTDALCRAATGGDNVAGLAVATLDVLHEDPAAACNE